MQAKYIEMRPALAESMPKMLRALDKRLKDRLGQPLPSLQSDTPSQASSPFQPYSLADLQKEEIPERHWIIDEVMPEGVHLVAGPVGIGQKLLGATALLIGGTRDESL